ncbi:MAG: hypothetical protein K8R60_04500 [Burkholderiales bacterium]|nr:hypothetical protein [Burkholderiales bacterium]
MKATAILAGAALPTFETWTTIRGVVKRHELHALDTADAVDRTFALYPCAEAVSARLLRAAPPRDALGQLARRAA